MEVLTAVIAIGIAVNTIINAFWFFILNDIKQRLSRLEDRFINK